MKKIIFVVIFLVLVLLGVRFLLGGDASSPGGLPARREDTWNCEGGEWVRHGNPSSPRPAAECGFKIVEKAKENLSDSAECLSASGGRMTYSKAKEIAASSCSGGKLKEEHFCNQTTGTWWIDFTPNTPKEGCNPACVVDVDRRSAEINWRCTGLKSSE
ncbi:hypothetical protein A3A76_04715 [Candidatus Woesebacteria bacterium RIFCSPLOWO2_01_FULL_39_23]|uniref:Uncharacterized protein n=2 Tax=Microgenomates group TaxID=1794810 RepID=A0A0H4TNK5_9BACT|nr:hypothetical protein [uncultured Microgenomates bacterium Rifle_16ft_4_minimus_37633]OGM13786.1 MAG: hypothetical protein A2141_03940 [Candidatus Woesebacteria bacterium RBG_16_40_11]OGM27736.1 MAG: hypothetical protein A2628_04935 [Candidatus Woesebacteria bacterium RIFCSPHIGHO2_01_FULL_40_22]OGM62158.1 MAG: hypothetical protein A3A76_04715 [Candidatus Woesebacteria bacterium RIFCSPLOWO2_01_FULL_39_23]